MPMLQLLLVLLDFVHGAIVTLGDDSGLSFQMPGLSNERGDIELAFFFLFLALFFLLELVLFSLC